MRNKQRPRNSKRKSTHTYLLVRQQNSLRMVHVNGQTATVWKDISLYHAIQMPQTFELYFFICGQFAAQKKKLKLSERYDMKFFESFAYVRCDVIIIMKIYSYLNILPYIDVWCRWWNYHKVIDVLLFFLSQTTSDKKGPTNVYTEKEQHIINKPDVYCKLFEFTVKDFIILFNLFGRAHHIAML